MMRDGTLRLLLVLVAVTCAACGDDDASGGGDGDGDGPAPSCEGELDPDDSGLRAITYFCNEDPSADPEADNACRNASDCALIDTDEVRGLAKDCGLAARGMEADCDAFDAFNEECVITETRTKIMDPGISPACAKCYAATVACGSKFCLSECAADADAPDCTECQLKAGCRLPFERCTGLERE